VLLGRRYNNGHMVYSDSRQGWVEVTNLIPGEEIGEVPSNN
jgi:hypothetical protein